MEIGKMSIVFEIELTRKTTGKPMSIARAEVMITVANFTLEELLAKTLWWYSASLLKIYSKGLLYKFHLEFKRDILLRLYMR